MPSSTNKLLIYFTPIFRTCKYICYICIENCVYFWRIYSITISLYTYVWGDIMEFKIKKTEYINKTFRIEKELNDKLNVIAGENEISVNELVVQCINFAISNMNNDK